MSLTSLNINRFLQNSFEMVAKGFEINRQKCVNKFHFIKENVTLTQPKVEYLQNYDGGVTFILVKSISDLGVTKYNIHGLSNVVNQRSMEKIINRVLSKKVY
ncbi:hypothetical protein [Proteus mirabilis]|uniref:hypothetical protein n=1 Tax=Proteus mirabilis TaxID=584 RepID=UPI0034D62094